MCGRSYHPHNANSQRRARRASPQHILGLERLPTSVGCIIPCPFGEPTLHGGGARGCTSTPAPLTDLLSLLTHETLVHVAQEALEFAKFQSLQSARLLGERDAARAGAGAAGERAAVAAAVRGAPPTGVCTYWAPSSAQLIAPCMLPPPLFLLLPTFRAARKSCGCTVGTVLKLYYITFLLSSPFPFSFTRALHY